MQMWHGEVTGPWQWNQKHQLWAEVSVPLSFPWCSKLVIFVNIRRDNVTMGGKKKFVPSHFSLVFITSSHFPISIYVTSYILLIRFLKVNNPLFNLSIIIIKFGKISCESPNLGQIKLKVSNQREKKSLGAYFAMG